MMAAPVGRSHLFANRPYLFYFVGTTVSMVGTGMQFIANSWLILELTNQSHAVALLLIASALPGILLSTLIGVHVDRYDRKWLSVGMDLFRALILLGVPVLWSYGLLRPWHLYSMAFLVAVGDQIYIPSVMGLVREVIPPDLLLHANSTTGIANQVGALLGAGLGGIVVAFTSPVSVMVINACTFLFSALCISNMRRGIHLPVAREAGARGLRMFWNELKEGIRFTRTRPDITVTYMLMLVLTATLRTINVLLAPFAKQELKIGAHGFGYVDAAFALGAIAGNFYLPHLVRVCGARWTMTAGMVGLSLSLLTFSVAQGLTTAILGYFLIGTTFQVRILYLTKAQEGIPLSHQGRVHATFNTLFSLVSFGVYLAMGYFGEVVSQRWLYAVQGLLVGCAALAAYFSIYRAKEGEQVVS